MDLSLFDELVRARSDSWTSSGVAWKLTRGKPTPKPAAWLVLRFGAADGQLTVWVSGEAELDWGGGPTGAGARHYDLWGREDLAGAIADLEAAIGLTTQTLRQISALMGQSRDDGGVAAEHAHLEDLIAQLVERGNRVETTFRPSQGGWYSVMSGSLDDAVCSEAAALTNWIARWV